jgi:superfamily I DNA/RNA helicase
VALAAYLQAMLADLQNVVVLHFDGWCKANGVVRQRGEAHESLGTRLRDRLAEGYGDARAYDAVLIDEAQDFDPVWFACALEALKDPNDGDLLIVGDRQQGIFGPRKVTWSQLGVNARGRTYSAKLDLDRNYRNAAEILALAARFARDAGIEGEDEDGFGVVPVDPAKCLRRTGVRPMLAGCRDRRHECDRAVEVVAKLAGHNGAADPRFPAGIDPADPRGIGILYPRLEARTVPVFEQFLVRLREVGAVVWLSNKERDDRRRVADPGMKVQTIESAKGLQYRAVIVLWADLLPAGFAGRTEDDDAKLMYVALTRAEDYLVVTFSSPSPFVTEMGRSGLTQCY